MSAFTIKAHYSFIGRPSPKGFRFHYFRLRYPNQGVTPRLLSKDFTGQGDPILALAHLRAFMVKKGLMGKGARFDETFDTMLAAPCGYARSQDAEGHLQIVPTINRLAIKPMDLLYKVVGGLGSKGVKIEPSIINDTPRFERGQIIGGKGENIPAHLLGILHPLDAAELREHGFAIGGWKVYVLADTVQVGRRQMSQFLKTYAEERLKYWNEVLNYVAPEMREAHD